MSGQGMRLRAEALHHSLDTMVVRFLGLGLVLLGALAWREGLAISALARAGLDGACGLSMTSATPLLFGHCGLCYGAAVIAAGGGDLLVRGKLA